MHTVVVDLRSVVGFESSLALAQGNLTCVVCVCCVVGDEGNITLTLTLTLTLTRTSGIIPRRKGDLASTSRP